MKSPASGPRIIPSGRDAWSEPVTRPWISLGVRTLTSVMLSSNGYLSSDPASSGNDSSNDCPLPAVPSSGGGARIYNVHDDLVTTTFFHEYQPSCARPADRGTGVIGCTIFQWDDVTHAGGGGPWDTRQIEEQIEARGQGSLEDLIYSGELWTVGEGGKITGGRG